MREVLHVDEAADLVIIKDVSNMQLYLARLSYILCILIHILDFVRLFQVIFRGLGFAGDILRSIEDIIFYRLAQLSLLSHFNYLEKALFALCVVYILRAILRAK